MSEQNSQVHRLPERSLLPDLIRSFAVIGIVLVNVALFANPIDLLYLNGSLNTPLDRTLDSFVTVFFLSKSYALFSLMFGAGLAFQMVSAERQGKRFGPRYARRLIGLLILGIGHAVFFFMGDILVTYSILGALLYRCRNATSSKLIKWGVILLVFQILLFLAAYGVLWAGETYAPEEMPTLEVLIDESGPTYQAYKDGTFFEVARFRLNELLIIIPMAVFLQGFSIFAYFLIGLAIVKTGSIHNPSAPIWKKFRWGLFPIGLGFNIIGAVVAARVANPASSEAMLSMTFISIGAPMLALGYVGWIAKFAEGKGGFILRLLARGGGATLTAYLLQSIILSYIFCGYGLGLYSQLGAAQCILIAFSVGLFSLVFVAVWRNLFSRGPFEMLLRRFTYLEAA